MNKIITLRIELNDDVTSDEVIQIGEGLKDLIYDEEPLVKYISLNYSLTQEVKN